MACLFACSPKVLACAGSPNFAKPWFSGFSIDRVVPAGRCEPKPKEKHGFFNGFDPCCSQTMFFWWCVFCHSFKIIQKHGFALLHQLKITVFKAFSRFRSHIMAVAAHVPLTKHCESWETQSMDIERIAKRVGIKSHTLNFPQFAVFGDRHVPRHRQESIGFDRKRLDSHEFS